MPKEKRNQFQIEELNAIILWFYCCNLMCKKLSRCNTYFALETRKSDCQEVLDHFSDQVDAVEKEIEGLKAAKITLSGMGQTAGAAAEEA